MAKAKKTAARRRAAKTSSRSRKPARPQKRAKAAPKKTTRKASARKVRRPAPKRAAKVAKPQPKARRKPSPRPAPRRAQTAARTKTSAPARAKAKAPKAAPRAASPAPAAAAKAASAKAAALQRERRRLPDAERLDATRDMSDDHMMAAARTGHRGMKADLEKYTETSPELTAGDVDAKWEDAYAVGDEAPGGDNPTPDQDRVDDIGKALGVTYQDNEELQGGDEIGDRDAKRWELDPASSDDWPHKE
jgi:hypothetical protein